MMTSIPGGYVTRTHTTVLASTEVPCTCGAKDAAAAISDERNRRQTKIQPAFTTNNDSSSSNSSSTTLCAPPQSIKRSLWRKVLGKPPKCICRKLARKAAIAAAWRQQAELAKAAESDPLVQIPHEYVGCTNVLVAGKRVAFTRDMQQKLRKSWDPLEAIDED